MAHRLYRQIEGIENKLIGVMDLYEPDERKKTEFMGRKIQSPEAFCTEIENGDTAVLAAVGSAGVCFLVRDYIQKYKYREDRLFVVNPYTTLRFCCIDDGLASETRIPVTDSRYRKVQRLFTDAESQKIYQLLVTAKPYESVDDTYEIVPYSQIKDMYYYEEDYWNHYEFPERPKAAEATVLDCGAYIGDSIEQICSRIPQEDIYYYAFEPYGENAAAIEKNERFRQICRQLTVYQYGVGAEDTFCSFRLPDSGDLEGGRFIEGSQESEEQCLQIRRLDGLDLDIRGQLYIKMDIEGSELDALKGAEQLIQRHKPYLAICLYHRKNDLLYIPTYLADLMPEYKFYLRGGYHTILWAVPEDEKNTD